MSYLDHYRSRHPRRTTMDVSSFWMIVLLTIVAVCSAANVTLMMNWELRYQRWQRNLDEQVQQLQEKYNPGR